jgi:hypothetical protein
MTGVRGLLIGLALLISGGALLVWADASPFGWIGLAGVAGVIGTGRWGRRIIGVVVLMGAVGAALQGPTVAGWFGVGLLGLGGCVMLWGAAQWPTLGSRFDRAPKQDLWSQLDRGEDPTLPDSRA